MLLNDFMDLIPEANLFWLCIMCSVSRWVPPRAEPETKICAQGGYLACDRRERK